MVFKSNSHRSQRMKIRNDYQWLHLLVKNEKRIKIENYFFRDLLLAQSGSSSLTYPRSVATLTLDTNEGIVRVFVVNEVTGSVPGSTEFGAIHVFEFNYNESVPSESSLAELYTFPEPGDSPGAAGFSGFLLPGPGIFFVRSYRLQRPCCR